MAVTFTFAERMSGISGVPLIMIGFEIQALRHMALSVGEQRTKRLPPTQSSSASRGAVEYWRQNCGNPEVPHEKHC